MDQQTYLKKFSYIVKWRLPRPEADEVLADYEEIFSQCPEENKGLLIQELGEPLRAARLLTEPKVYRRWLAVFGLMSFCLLLPEFMLLRARFHQYPMRMMTVMLAAGLAAVLIWFRPRQGERKCSPVPKGLFLMLAGLLLIITGAVAVLAGLSAGEWEFLPQAMYGRTAYRILSLSGTAGAMSGFYGLVKARTSDRCWCALYVMGLMVLVECVLAAAVLASMNLDVQSSGWWVPYAVNSGILGLAGFAGVGVSLC